MIKNPRIEQSATENVGQMFQTLYNTHWRIERLFEVIFSFAQCSYIHPIIILQWLIHVNWYYSIFIESFWMHRSFRRLIYVGNDIDFIFSKCWECLWSRIANVKNVGWLQLEGYGNTKPFSFCIDGFILTYLVCINS